MNEDGADGGGGGGGGCGTQALGGDERRRYENKE